MVINSALTHILFMVFAATGLAGGHSQEEEVEITGVEEETVEKTSVEPQVSEKAESDEDKKVLAKKEFARGQKLFLREKYEEAVGTFNTAYEHWPYRVIHYNLALTYTFMKEDENAYRHLQLYLKKASESERDLPGELRDLQRRMGMIVIRVNNPRATIHVDGKQVGTGTSEHIVRSGTREVVIKLDDRKAAQNTVEVTGGEVQIWELHLGDSPPPYRKSFRKLHWGFFTAAAGATLVSLVTSTALSVRTKKLHDEFMNNRSDADLRALGIRTKRGAEAMWSITGLLAVGTAATAFFTRWRKEEKTLIVVAVPSERGAMLSITWSH